MRSKKKGGDVAPPSRPMEELAFNFRFERLKQNDPVLWMMFASLLIAAGGRIKIPNGMQTPNYELRIACRSVPDGMVFEVIEQ